MRTWASVTWVAVALGHSAAHAQQVEGRRRRRARGGQRGAQGDDALLHDAGLEGHAGALAQDVLELLGIVGREDHALLAQAALDAGSRNSVNFKSLLMPMTLTLLCSRSLLMRLRL